MFSEIKPWSNKWLTFIYNKAFCAKEFKNLFSISQLWLDLNFMMRMAMSDITLSPPNTARFAFNMFYPIKYLFFLR